MDEVTLQPLGWVPAFWAVPSSDRDASIQIRFHWRLAMATGVKVWGRARDAIEGVVGALRDINLIQPMSYDFNDSLSDS